jgi:hypothetical protein
MSDGEPSDRRVRGWKLLAMIASGLPLIGISFFTWWLFSDGDLDDVRAEARRQGQPATWEERNLTPANDARLALWNRITALSKKLKSYRSAQALKQSMPEFKSFAPIPDELRAFHAKLDAASVAELMTLLDQLGDQPLVLRREMTFATLVPEIGTIRELVRLLEERAALSDAAEASRHCRRALALCRAFSSHCVIQHLVHVSVTEIVLTMVATHLREFKLSDPGIADAMLETTQGLPNELIPALQGEFLCNLTMTSQRDLNPGEGNTGGWFAPIVVRIGRHEMLSAQLDAITQLKHLDLAGAVAWAEAQDAALSAEIAAAKRGGSSPGPGLILRGLTAPVYAVIAMGHRTALRGRLLAAELRGQPWPRDSFEPTGATLRAFMRDGTLVGAYTVDKDGIDDGGDAKKDHYFPLYGPREASKKSR